MRRLELAEPGRDERVAVWIDMSGLCYGRAAETGRRPVDNEPEHYYGGEVEKAFVETMGEWQEKDDFHDLRDIHLVCPTSNIQPEPGSISFWLRNDGLVCIFTHILFRPKIMLDREPLMDALRELRDRILEWDRPKGHNS